MFNYLNTITLDIRVNNNIRFMDQKVTPDVLSVIADCILNFVNEKLQNKNIQEVAFSVEDIWNSPYAKNIIPHLFAKPTLHNETAEREYDKFFAQPLNSLAYADILTYSSNLKPRLFFNFVENSWWNKKNHQYDNLKTNFV